MNDYIPVIGLEIHVELKTKSKMFCQCRADYFGKEPNSQVCPVCLGMPGALPVPNIEAIKYCQLIGKALNCKIAKSSKFDRKHYFYPDLPKGYQISQYDEPFCLDGQVEITGKRFGITRVHMEEDTGKLLHVGEDTLVDFNRSGVPLVEIVTEPDFSSPEDVKKFLEELQVVIRYLEVSDADMEKGSMRLEPNISLRNVKTQMSNVKAELPKYKVEVKNINSFRFVQRAIEYEIKRQAEILDKGETPVQETRGFNEGKGITFSQRTKEEAQDYRYFPEPDIPPFEFSSEYLEGIKKKLPETPNEIRKRYLSRGIKLTDADILVRDKKLREIFDAIPDAGQMAANVIINRRVTSLKQAQELISKLSSVPQVNQKALENAIDIVVKKNIQAVSDFKSGKEGAIMFLVGQVMRLLKGQADAQIVKSEIEKKLKK